MCMCGCSYKWTTCYCPHIRFVRGCVFSTPTSLIVMKYCYICINCKHIFTLKVSIPSFLSVSRYCDRWYVRISVQILNQHIYCTKLSDVCYPRNNWQCTLWSRYHWWWQCLAAKGDCDRNSARQNTEHLFVNFKATFMTLVIFFGVAVSTRNINNKHQTINSIHNQQWISMLHLEWISMLHLECARNK